VFAIPFYVGGTFSKGPPPLISLKGISLQGEPIFYPAVIEPIGATTISIEYK
jgi:hypothetical protein